MNLKTWCWRVPHDDRVAIDDHVPGMRPRISRDHADGRLPVYLRVQAVPRALETEDGTLLRLLLLRVSAVSSNPGGANGPKCRRGALSRRFTLRTVRVGQSLVEAQVGRVNGRHEEKSMRPMWLSDCAPGLWRRRAPGRPFGHILAIVAAAGAWALSALGTSAEQPDGARANRLIKSANPYLLPHAHNPVDWYPWGEEAIAKAKKENKPIFVSVGYSTCFWCHVQTIYANAAIAALMSQWFVNIKVDREERPDIDETHMLARNLLTGSGGWPNNLFLTPDLKPFFDR